MSAISNNSLTALAVTTPPPAQPAAPPPSLSDENIFLQLLVAQLKNQDPQNPADGTQFVTQLAQFTTLQENTKSTQDLDAILKIVQKLAVPAAPVTPKAAAANTLTNTA